jgi:signal transduction histidine kinase
LARPDELAEAVSILLDNAARHAPGSEVVIGARETGDVVEIFVADSGPGVPSSAAERLFDWGYAGPGSDGQGIGLAVARQLLEDVGGYLRLEEFRPGAHFVLGFRRADGETGRIAAE